MNNVRKPDSIFLEIICFLIFILLIMNLSISLIGVKIKIIDNVPKFVFESDSIQNGLSAVDSEKIKNYALKLKSNGFIDETAIEFEKYLSLTKYKEAVSIYYDIANQYLEKYDYKKALLYLFKCDFFDPTDELKTNISSKEIECLEKLGRSIDALNLLNAKTNPEEKNDVNKNSKVLAQIGNTVITLKKLSDEIQNLPKYIQDKIKNNKDEKKKLLQQLVMMQLLYNKAIRMSADKDPEIIKKIESLRFQYLAETMLEAEIGKIPEPTQIDLENYYNAHISDYKTKDDKKQEITKPFNEVIETVKTSYLMDKKTEKLNSMLKDLSQAEKVEIYYDRIE